MRPGERQYQGWRGEPVVFCGCHCHVLDMKNRPVAEADRYTCTECLDTIQQEWATFLQTAQ